MRTSSALKISVAAALICAAALALPLAIAGAGPKFYTDDPLMREPASQDASKAEAWDIDLGVDLILNLFSSMGVPESNLRAQNVNAIDEVPDSSWFTNRAGARPVTIEEATRGPNTIDGPAPGRWTVIRPKTSGFAPGFTVRDSKGEVWFITFDPPSSPGAATGAIAVASRIFWTLGYNQAESYLSSTRREELDVDPAARVRTPSGKRRPMRMSDVNQVLARSAHGPDGSYRVLAARLIPGKILGGFRYHGTRPDDPNDIVPHEHRRELRALKVFGAWTNLVDMKAGNTLDALITENGKGIVRHYLQDVGSTFGTGAQGPREYDEGYEYLYEGGPTFKRLISFGLYMQPWQRADYRELPEIGRFEGDTFDPLKWVSRVPAVAVLHARDDDTFWAARRVAAFSDELIRAIVKEGRYTDPEAEKLLGDVLIKRRDKIARAYLPKLNPATDFTLSADGALAFENAAVQAHVAEPPSGGYKATWFSFDNATSESRAIGAPTTGAASPLRAPEGLPTATDAYVKVEVSATDPAHASWATPVQVYFKRVADGWKLVGVERQ